ncbi:MAG: hypothetical protein KC646_00575 [Candidatus Cloacimonetes bacterium]|nr:hypothetical protein [Candidatus Cloacimonadota bacterium]
MSFLLCGCETTKNQKELKNLRPTLDVNSNDDSFISSTKSPIDEVQDSISTRSDSIISADQNPSHQVLSPTASCDVLAYDSKKVGVRHLVISFEGLGSKYIGFVRKNITRKIQKELNYNFATKGYGWTDTEAAYDCVSTWSNLMKDQLQLTVVGHSFGAGIATFKFLDKLQASEIKVDNVITLDPRTGSNGGKLKNKFMHFQKPDHVKLFVNFWQKNGLRGYGVEGAENIQITNSGHVGLASNKKIYNRIKTIIKNTSDDNGEVVEVQSRSDENVDLSFEGLKQDD